MAYSKKNKVMFGRGSKTMTEFQGVEGWQNMIYFNTTTSEIYVGEKKYGFSEDDKALLKSAIDSISYDAASSTFTVSFVDSTKADATFSIPVVGVEGENAPGLMTAAHVTRIKNLETVTGMLAGEGAGSVKKAQADAEAYALGLVEALDLAEVKAAGQAIVSISQVDGQVSAAAGDIAAAHVTVADTAGKYNASDVEGVFAEIATKIASLDNSAEGVEGKISAAIEELDSEVKDESKAHVKVAVSQVDGKLTSVVVTEDNIADKSVVDGLVSSVGASGDAASASGSVYARIAALVAEDSVLDGRLDVIEGEGAGSVKKALADAKTYVNEEIAKLDADVTSTESTKFSVEVVEVDGKITDVIVTDTDVASADALSQLTTKVNAFLDAEGLADKTLDTLKEIQDFINNEAGAADEMLLAIGENKAAIEKEVTDRENAIKGLNTPTGGVKGEGTFVDVTVKQEAGVITSVTVDEADIASAAALKNLSDTVGTSSDGKEAATVFGKIVAEADARTQAVNTINGKISDVEDTIAANKTAAEKYADDAVKVLKDGEVAANADAIAQEIEDRQAGDEAALNAAKAYTDESLYWYEG